MERLDYWSRGNSVTFAQRPCRFHENVRLVEKINSVRYAISEDDLAKNYAYRLTTGLEELKS